MAYCVIINAQDTKDDVDTKDEDMYDISKDYELLSKSISISSDSLEKDDYDAMGSMELPPLSLFLETAEKHSTIRIYDEIRIQALMNYKTTRQKWLNYLRISVSYSYGQNYAVNASADVDNPSYFYQNSNSRRSQYGISANISIPISDIFGGHKYAVKTAKSKLKELEYQYQTTLEKRKLTILDAYNSVVQELAVFKAKAEAAALYNAQMQISEQAFINGDLDIIALSLERSRRTGALVTYESGRVSLKNAITLLEMLTNVKVLDR